MKVYHEHGDWEKKVFIKLKAKNSIELKTIGKICYRHQQKHGPSSRQVIHGVLL